MALYGVGLRTVRFIAGRHVIVFHALRVRPMACHGQAIFFALSSFHTQKVALELVATLNVGYPIRLIRDPIRLNS